MTCHHLAKNPAGGCEPELEQLPKLFRGKACVLGDGSHGKSVDGIVTWNGQADIAIAHDDV